MIFFVAVCVLLVIAIPLVYSALKKSGQAREISSRNEFSDDGTFYTSSASERYGEPLDYKGSADPATCSESSADSVSDSSSCGNTDDSSGDSSSDSGSSNDQSSCFDNVREHAGFLGSARLQVMPGIACLSNRPLQPLTGAWRFFFQGVVNWPRSPQRHLPELAICLASPIEIAAQPRRMDHGKRPGQKERNQEKT